MRCLAILLCLVSASLAAQETDDASGLIKADGWQLVRIHCGGCHSHKLVTGQRGDRQSWLAVIRWMQATQNLWQFDEATEDGILSYLARNYPPRSDRRLALDREGADHLHHAEHDE